MRPVVLAAAIVTAVAVPAAAAPSAEPVECVKQFVIVAEPAPRPVRRNPDGSVTVDASELTGKVARDAARTTRLATCLAS